MSGSGGTPPGRGNRCRVLPSVVGELDAAGQPVFGPVSITLLAVVVTAPVVGLIQAAALRRKPRAAQDLAEQPFLDDAVTP